MTEISDEELLRRYVAQCQVVRQTTLEVCDICKGLGHTTREELSDYHRREYVDIHELCKRCGGEGRYLLHTRRVRTPGGEQERRVEILTPESLEIYRQRIKIKR